MKRREFITLLGGAAAAWPLAARAEQAAMPVIGFLHSVSADLYVQQLAAFRRGLKEGGFVEGQNLTIEYRWAEGRADRLPALAADLVRRRMAVIVAVGGTHSTMAAKNATTIIPIVFATGGDPIKLGMVPSLAHPGGNITGVSFFSSELTPKALGLLSQIAPKARTVGMLFNPMSPENAHQPADVRAAAGALGLELLVLNASTDEDIDRAFRTLLQRGAGALVISSDPFYAGRLERLAALTQRHRIPATYFRREFPDAGGLMSYGTSVMDALRQVGIYTARILKGDRPADLPVMLPTKFEFVINLKTAHALGLEVPAGVSAMADEVIE
jgi:putative tryptophan/tyrosine transport system substrate-binding protein